MEKALKTEGWTLLDFEGIPIEESLPSKAAAVHAMLTDDGYDYEIRAENGGGFRLWTLDRSRHSAGQHRFTGTVIFSLEDDEVKAEAEIFEKVADMAGEWHGRSGYRIVTDADRAAELAEDEDEQPGVVRLDGQGIYFNEAASFMDDDLREELHQKLAPCADQVFMDAYAKAHLEKFGEAFQV